MRAVITREFHPFGYSVCLSMTSKRVFDSFARAAVRSSRDRLTLGMPSFETRSVFA
jgi:hypothetical protein